MEGLLTAARALWQVPDALGIVAAPGASALIARIPALAAESGVLVHDYGKKESRTGRKMGHFTRLVARIG